MKMERLGEEAKESLRGGDLGRRRWGRTGKGWVGRSPTHWAGEAVGRVGSPCWAEGSGKEGTALSL